MDNGHNGYIDFDSLAPPEIKFRQKGQEYTLLEPSDDAHSRVERAKLRNTKVQDGKLSADVYDIFDSQASMLSYCVVDSAGKPVPREVIKTWGTRVVRTLYEKVEEMGQFNKKETAEQIKARMEADRKKLEMLEKGETYAGNS